MIKKQLEDDIKKALQEKNKGKLEVLRFLSAQIKDREIEKGRQELKDEEVIKIISQQIKKAEESLEHFKKSGRKDLIEKAEFELKILKNYLPKQMSEEEIKKEVKKIVEENKNINQPGPLIGMAIKKLGSKADSKKISSLMIQEFKNKNK
jgi:uncharacterized protein